jgi:hypothetical protein
VTHSWKYNRLWVTTRVVCAELVSHETNSTFQDKIERSRNVASVESMLNRNWRGQAGEHVQLSGGHFVVALKKKMEHELGEEDSVRQTSFQRRSETALSKMFPTAARKIHDMQRFG